MRRQGGLNFGKRKKSRERCALCVLPKSVSLLLLTIYIKKKKKKKINLFNFFFFFFFFVNRRRMFSFWAAR